MAKKLDPKFEKALTAWVAHCQGLVSTHFKDNLSNLSIPEISFTVGRKYVKVISEDNQTFVWAFINMENGDIMKPASWKAPAKHARGNIYADDKGHNCVTAHGVVYMR